MQYKFFLVSFPSFLVRRVDIYLYFELFRRFFLMVFRYVYVCSPLVFLSCFFFFFFFSVV